MSHGFKNVCSFLMKELYSNFANANAFLISGGLEELGF